MQSAAPLRMACAMNQHRMVEEPRWHAALAVVAALALYLTLPPKITLGPYWLLPLLVLVPLIALMVVKPKYHQETSLQRAAAIWNIAILNVFNVATVVLMIQALAGTPHHPPKNFSGTQILAAAVQIWLTNIIVYALWYFELDGGGPDARAHAAFEQVHRRADFLFPQMALGPDVQKRYGFRPRFFDYVYLAFNTATAFSPADTYPLTSVGKALMLGESLTSLVTLAVVASRAINILS
jgi:hypothetical protein